MLLVKTHGSLNEIFAAEATPGSFGSDAELRTFVRRVCDREAWTGGSDGIYFFDASTPDAQAWFFNPDGSPAELCGNGMRGLGRLILDRRGTDTEVIGSSGRQYTVRRAASTPEGVRQVQLELPADLVRARTARPVRRLHGRHGAEPARHLDRRQLQRAGPDRGGPARGGLVP